MQCSGRKTLDKGSLLSSLWNAPVRPRAASSDKGLRKVRANALNPGWALSRNMEDYIPGVGGPRQRCIKRAGGAKVSLVARNAQAGPQCSLPMHFIYPKLPFAWPPLSQPTLDPACCDKAWEAQKLGNVAAWRLARTHCPCTGSHLTQSHAAKCWETSIWRSMVSLTANLYEL